MCQERIPTTTDKPFGNTPNNRPMKHLLTLTALLISSLAMGQMPYNPDSNGDDLIGATDLISVLGLYNTLMVDSSLTCSYEGTELESWVGGLFDGTLILDSVYVEYVYSDSVPTYLPGCPEPVMIETVLERGYMMPTWFSDNGGYDNWQAEINYLGYYRSVNLRFDPSYGGYQLFFLEYEIEEFTNYGSYASWNGSAPSCCNNEAFIPFPNNWTLDENGIQVDWMPYHWVADCEHFRLIPYWSEAE